METVAVLPLTHDILRFDPAALVGQEVPDWVEDSLKTAPFAVVRRMSPQDGRVPVGIRGVQRHQRWGGWLDLHAVEQCWRPEDLVALIPTLPACRVSALPALQAVQALVDLLDPSQWVWGPTGSVGFEVVTGQPTAKVSSDLDLILRCDQPLDRRDAQQIVACLQGLSVRCDMLLETPRGAVALLEYARDTETVVVRTADGPQVVTSPWREAEQ